MDEVALLHSDRRRVGIAMDTMARIKRLFVDRIDVTEEALRPEATLDSLGLDSLDKIEFLFALEEEFQIKIDERSKKLHTIRDAVNLIDTILSEQPREVTKHIRTVKA